MENTDTDEMVWLAATVAVVVEVAEDAVTVVSRLRREGGVVGLSDYW